MLKIGDKFTINCFLCEDTDLLDWYDEQENKILTINEIDNENGYIWVKNCPYAIWITEICKCEV